MYIYIYCLGRNSTNRITQLIDMSFLKKQYAGSARLNKQHNLSLIWTDRVEGENGHPKLTSGLHRPAMAWVPFLHALTNE